MPLPPVTRSRSKLAERSEVHPYVIKLEVKLTMMHTLMNRIFDIADSNLLITDAKTGLNDYTMNHNFADKLESLSKEVNSLGQRLCEKAEEIRQKVDRALDEK